MSSIQDLIGKIEKNQERKNNASSKKESKVKKTLSPKELQLAREKFSGKKEHSKENKLSKKLKKSTNKKTSKQENKKKRFFVTELCMSKKSCADNSYAPYVWERLCNDYNQDPECDFFEIQGFRFEKSTQCQGACKKAANIRIKEEDAKNHTQFSYLTPIKASKLIQIIKSGATPENIKKL